MLHGELSDSLFVGLQAGPKKNHSQSKARFPGKAGCFGSLVALLWSVTFRLTDPGSSQWFLVSYFADLNRRLRPDEIVLLYAGCRCRFHLPDANELNPRSELQAPDLAVNFACVFANKKFRLARQRNRLSHQYFACCPVQTSNTFRYGQYHRLLS
ncbi:hypothetical protein D3C75_683540 [compost metagenome]